MLVRNRAGGLRGIHKLLRNDVAILGIVQDIDLLRALRAGVHRHQPALGRQGRVLEEPDAGDHHGPRRARQLPRPA